MTIMHDGDMAGTALSATPSKASIEGWPTMSEAKEQLQVSERSMWRYAKTGAIQIRKRPRPGKRAENVCNPRDIARLMPSDVHVMPAETKAITIRRPAPKTWEGALERALDRLVTVLVPAEPKGIAAPRPDTMPIAKKLWLSLDEAAEYSGLARADLLMLCRTEMLTTRKSGGWKILRKSLEEFEG
jgi:hypothetical protein